MKHSEKRERAELLSPAGNIECFHAAINAGADAIYMGLPRFGARQFAGNLSLDEYIDAIDYAHLFSKKVYLTLNILIKDREIEELDALFKPLYAAGLDGVIVQDIGLISYIRDNYPLINIHVSTQAFVTGSYGATICKELGASRIVLPRELSIDEIKSVKEKAGIDIECFIHGAMCYSYSGMCLMSSFLGGRSGNRGRCAGPCRQPYNGGDYLLSMKDLCTVQEIGELISAGADSLKIEGRMKSKEYVYFVTKLYRKYIDAYYEEGRVKADKKDLSDLVSLYSRGGLNKGYLYKNNGPEMLTREKGNYTTDLPGMPKEERQSLKVKCRAEFNKGRNAALTLEYGEHKIRTEGISVSEAEGAPLDEAAIRKQLNKTGNSAFSFEDIKISMDNGIFVPVSAINALRRSALDELKEDILGGYRRSL